MPEAIKASLTLNPNRLEDQPTLACQIAIIVSSWTDVEDELAMIYAYAMRTDPALAASTLGRVNGLQPRLDMIETALGISVSLTAKRHFRKTLRKQIGKCSHERSEIVHSHWTTHEDYPDRLIRTQGIRAPHAEFWAYTADDFVDIHIRILQLHIDLREFGQCIADDDRQLEPKEDVWQLSNPHPHPHHVE